MINTDTYLKQPGARGRLGGARRVAQPSAPSRPPFACDSPQRSVPWSASLRSEEKAGEGRSAAQPGELGAQHAPTPAFSSERCAAQVIDKENQGTGVVGLATQVCAAAAVAPSAVDATADAEQGWATPRCNGTGSAGTAEAAGGAAGAAEAAGALLLELLQPLQRAFEVASEGGGGGERALGAAMRSLGLPAHVVTQVTPHLAAATAAGQPLHQAVADALKQKGPTGPRGVDDHERGPGSPRGAITSAITSATAATVCR